MSAQDHEGNPPQGEGAAPDAPAAPATEAAEGAPADGGASVITSHGEAEARAYVGPTEVPKRHQRLKTMDMAKVRISADMKVEVQDPRNLPTTRMEVPPGGLRPPPPPASAEIGDPASSPWSHSTGIDRSLLPSSSLGPAVAPTATRAPQKGSSDDEEGSRSIGIWIGVVLVAALLGGGAAYLLRGRVTSGGGAAANSGAPIAVTVPTTSNVPLPPVTASTTEPTPEEPAEATEDAGAAPSDTATTQPTGTIRTPIIPRTTTTKTKTTPTTAPTPTATTSGPKRLF